MISRERSGCGAVITAQQANQKTLAANAGDFRGGVEFGLAPPGSFEPSPLGPALPGRVISIAQWTSFTDLRDGRDNYAGCAKRDIAK